MGRAFQAPASLVESWEFLLPAWLSATTATATTTSIEGKSSKEKDHINLKQGLIPKRRRKQEEEDDLALLHVFFSQTIYGIRNDKRERRRQGWRRGFRF